MLIARIFPRPFGARKNPTQLAKYPHVLYAKPWNKVYLFWFVKNSDWKNKKLKCLQMAVSLISWNCSVKFINLRFHQHGQKRRNERRRNFLNNDESMKSNVLTILCNFASYFYWSATELLSASKLLSLVTQKKTKQKQNKRMLKRSSSPLLSIQWGGEQFYSRTAFKAHSSNSESISPKFTRY